MISNEKNFAMALLPHLGHNNVVVKLYMIAVLYRFSSVLYYVHVVSLLVY